MFVRGNKINQETGNVSRQRKLRKIIAEIVTLDCQGAKKKMQPIQDFSCPNSSGCSVIVKLSAFK